MQEDEPDQGDAEHGVKESQYVYHAPTVSQALRGLHYPSDGTVSWAASTSCMKLATSRLAPPTGAPSTSSCAMSSATLSGLTEPRSEERRVGQECGSRR